MKRALVSTTVALMFAVGCRTAGPVVTEPATVSVSTPPASTAPSGGYNVPVEYHKLDNGLRVVLSPDRSAPTAVVAVYYGIGFRIEPRDRTGFAHLFEHMMFQGSENLGKMEFIRLIQSNGGAMNGSTRFDFTNYFQIVPAHALETILWAEADRMRGLAITQENLTNQQGVVKNEVRVNVLNQPYGGFPWLDMPQYANENWYNAHNFYGDLEDLDAATLEDVQSFFDEYYTPSNAVVAVTGDIDTAQTLAWVKKYFGSIPSRPRPTLPDISEPRQTAEKRFSKKDEKATRPAIAMAWHAPDRESPEYLAMGMIDQILGQGRDSRLHQSLVQRHGYTDEVSASMNFLGNMYNIYGPTLWTVSLLHDADTDPEAIIAAVDAEIEKLRSEPIDQATLDRTLIKIRSDLYDAIDGFYGFGRADLLASFALFFDDPARINTIEERFRQVTPEMIQRVAREYLRDTNRTILTLEPGAAAQN